MGLESSSFQICSSHWIIWVYSLYPNAEDWKGEQNRKMLTFQGLTILVVEAIIFKEYVLH